MQSGGDHTEQFDITGMSCAACSARVEKAVSAVPGVDGCSVNLLTNSMGVDGSASEASIIAAVEAAGYGASKKRKKSADSDALRDTQTPRLKKRLIASACLLLILMYAAMGHLPINSFALGVAQLLLAAAVMIINLRFFVSGFKGLAHRVPNMDTLVALGSGAAFGYSVYALFAGEGDLYFESAAMILTLITVGKLLEARSKGKTTNALRGLMSLAPKTAILVVDGRETEVPVEQIEKGSIFVVKPGAAIPADGVVVSGSAAVDESAVTGESIPVDKVAGDAVTAATVNQSGFLMCEATQVGEDTTLAQIIRTVSDAAATKAPIAKLADRVSGVFVPVVMVISLITFAAWMLAGETVEFSILRAVSVLVISCPCALGLATPVAVMVGSGIGAKNGILFKTAASLEETGKIKIAALDKTGTVTRGEPVVTDVIPAPGCSPEELLRAAFSLEKMSEHPLAKAIVAAVQGKGIAAGEITDFRAVAGNGLTGLAGNKALAGGNLSFIGEKADIADEIKKTALSLAQEGKTPLFFCENQRLLGVIAVADVIKDDSAAAINQLRAMGIRVVMLTGDNEQTAAAIGRQAGVDEVAAGVLPDEKAKIVTELRRRGKVAMVGDGINDAPALTCADIGIAIGAGTDIAIDAADAVLMKSSLADAAAAIRLSRATLRNIRENLFWAFFYNVIGIPLAAGVWIPIFGWTLSPVFGAAAMSLSSFCVVTNALRLNFFDMRSSKRDKAFPSDEPLLCDIKIKEDKSMITVKIEGMMCGHCEAHVKKALEALPGIKEATPNHQTGTALINAVADIPDESIKSAVENEGYKVLGIDR